MRRSIIAVVLLVGALTIASADYKPAFGGGIGFGLLGDEAGFQMNMEGLLPIYSGLHAKITAFSLSVGDGTILSFGTGANMGFTSGVSLLYFIPAGGNVEPYAGGGFSITSFSNNGYSATGLYFLFGGGAQFKIPSAPIKPYGELGFGISDSEIYGIDSDILFTINFGIRFGG